MAGAEQHQIRKYLLDQLEEAEQERVEVRLLADGEFAAEYDIVVDEVTDDYLTGKFTGDELERVQQYFFQSGQRRDKLEFAQALRRRKSEQGQKPVMRYLAVAAAVLLAVGAGLFVWQSRNSQAELNQGLAALQSAFRDERPLEARLSDFGYAPLANQRGGPSQIDYVQRDRAARLLLNAVSTHPNAASYHALGKSYLAERQFDKAIDQLRAALALDPKNARIHSDLGAALMEKGKTHLASPTQGQGIEEFAESLEQFNQAVALDSSLLEAYFNRALLYQYMIAPGEAAASWRDYLNRDPGSPWVDEAKRNLKLLEENQRRTSQNKDDALRSFLAAQQTGDDHEAWDVLGRNYTSAGNKVTNDLIDSLLDAKTESGSDEPSRQSLSYLANLELSKGGDRYTADLVGNYEQEAPKQRQLLADARRHMKTAYELFTQSKFTEAVSEYSAAEQEYEQAGNSAERVFVGYRLAHCYLFLPKLYNAEVAFQRLVVICENKEYRWLLAQCLSGLAHASYDSSEFSKSIDYSGRALDTYQQLGDVNGVLRCLTQLADANQALNRIERSLGYLGQGLALIEEKQADPMQRWGVLVQLAFSMKGRQRHAAELVYQKEALKIALEMARPLMITRSYGYLGTAYAALKMYPEALSAATNAFETGRSMPDLEIMANASQQLGDIRRQAHECDQAIAAYDRSIELYSNLSVDYYSYAAHKGKLFCLMTGSDDRIAGEELQKVLNLAAEYRSKITVESQRLSFFDTEQSVYDLAIYYEFVRNKDPLKAFDYSEGSRAKSLLDEVRQRTEVLRKSYGPDLHAPAVTKSLSPSQIQEKLRAGTQILQYAVLDDRILMWVVTNAGIRSEEKEIAAESLNEKVRGYLEEVNHPPKSDSVHQPERSQELYRLLIAPVEPFLDKSKFLCIVPDKILHYLPYNALISPATGRYLIEDYNLGTAPSSSVFVYLTDLAQQKAGALEEKLLIVGDPRFSRSEFDSLAALPSATAEAQAVAGFYHSPRVLLREEATEASIRSEIEKVDVVHLAAHYVLNPQVEMLSGFPLAPERSRATDDENANGFLQSYEIYSMNLSRPRLAILSACETGVGQEYGGEGVVSAARPFLVAGIPTVVASLWPVDSDASAELMASFHRHRTREALPVAEALQQAQVEMAHGQDARYRHPYYWAPFLAIGGLSTY